MIAQKLQVSTLKFLFHKNSNVGNTVYYNHKWISKKYSQKTELHKLDVMQSIVLCKDDVYPIFSSLNIQEQSRLYKSQSEHFSRQIVDVILPQLEFKAMRIEETKREKNTHNNDDKCRLSPKRHDKMFLPRFFPN